jgi:hypothetical protein
MEIGDRILFSQRYLYENMNIYLLTIITLYDEH